MTKKKTFEEVRAAFNQRGFTLLSKNYQDSKTSLNYLCDNGHQAKIRFSSLNQGHGCFECANDSKKKTFDEVESAFKLRDFTIVSKEYKNNNSPLDYICSQGHECKISYAHLKKDNGCAKCAGLKKKTIEEVRHLFESRGFKLLSKEYKNASSYLSYQCPKDHVDKMRYSDFYSGNGCPFCAGTKKKTIEEVRDFFTTRGYTLLSSVYTEAHSHLDYLCTSGHQSKITFAKLQQGRGCMSCAGTKKKTIEEVKREFDKKSFTLLSTEYKNSNSLLKYRCLNGHQNTTTFSHLKNGVGCSSCAEYGFNPSKSAILYYLRFQFEGNLYYKIGITNRKISERFSLEKTPYTIIKETFYPVGKDALSEEQAILKEFARFRYKGKPFLVSGNTELFTKDVLQLDYEPFQNFAA